jgi:hypothetical protein
MPEMTITQRGLPIPLLSNRETLTVNGQRYLAFRYSEGEGPTLAQTIEIAKSLKKEMLTLDEAKAIAINVDDESNRVFRRAMGLSPAVYGYVRDPKTESRNEAALIWITPKSIWCSESGSPHGNSSFVIFKETGNEAAPLLRETD